MRCFSGPQNLLESLRQTISLETTEATLETEIATIIEAIGGELHSLVSFKFLSLSVFDTYSSCLPFARSSRR